jgi:transcription initiation protein SPT3
MNGMVTLEPPGPPWEYPCEVFRLPLSAFEFKLTQSFQQMMFVSGETAEPSIETTGIIEDIVRQQVIELVSCMPTQSRGIELT